MADTHSAFATAWQDVLHSPGWFGRACLMALVAWIPIFGPIAVVGYMTGWARDAAWNLRQPMPERIFGNADGRQYSRGLFTWLLIIVYALVPSLCIGLLSGSFAVFLGDGSRAYGMVDAVLGLAAFAIDLILTFFVWVGALRVSIYGTLSSGFQLKKIWAMLGRDWGGAWRILGYSVLFGIVICIVLLLGIGAVSVIAGAAGVAMLVGTGFTAAGAASTAVGAMLAPMAVLLVAIILAAGYFCSVAFVVLHVVQWRAIGYWTAQFQVSFWQGQNDPMPFEREA